MIGQGIVAAQRLGNSDKGVFRNGKRCAIRNPPRRTIFLRYYYAFFCCDHKLIHTETFATTTIVFGVRIEKLKLVVNTFSDVVNARSEEHTSELQSRPHLVCRLLL